MEVYKYLAFISYSSQDTVWGKRLQRKLEGYRMPSTLCHERGWKRTPLKPVFFAPTDIQPGPLSDELQERIRASRHLIVICSPQSAQSQWVGREIAFFHSLGRSDRMHFFIVDGKPHSGDAQTECFNPVIQSLGLPEILAANINERNYRWSRLNRERAYVQLITKLLGIEFDTLWQRHKRRIAGQLVVAFALLLMVLGALVQTWRMSQPFDAQIMLYEASLHNKYLPPLKDAIVTLTLDNEEKCDTIATLSKTALLPNIPRRLLDSEAKLSIRCADCLPKDTTILLQKKQEIGICRDITAYGTIRFMLWNGRRSCPLPHVAVTVNGVETQSDDEGRVSLDVPLDRQRVVYRVESVVPLADTVLEAKHTGSTVIVTK